ncbi:hypothetical protein [Streptomyces sp. NPDC060031]|uniref:hypothetical protein n=1 Tax=Streptomyces sp. NPDC060031 TaxID=3347043 RepID=UPI00369936D9
MSDRFLPAALLGAASGFDANSSVTPSEGGQVRSAWAVTLEVRAVVALTVAPFVFLSGAWGAPMGVAMVLTLLSAASRSRVSYQRASSS